MTSRRDVWCHLEVEVEATADIVLSVAVAEQVPRLEEEMVVTLEDRPLELREVGDRHGTRLHVGRGLEPGLLVVDYRATVADAPGEPTVEAIDLIRYCRPSRYCESDRLHALARAEFHDLEGHALLDAITSWVGQRIAYIPGSSRSTDGAVTTLLSREGVCRDFAHLVVALLRSCDIPARLVSVYAPGLEPMDFHAVAEAYVEGRWLLADATAMAPRSSLVRIATGRDAADTAFLTSTRGEVQLRRLEVGATTEGTLPQDDVTADVAMR